MGKLVDKYMNASYYFLTEQFYIDAYLNEAI